MKRWNVWFCLGFSKKKKIYFSLFFTKCWLDQTFFSSSCIITVTFLYIAKDWRKNGLNNLIISLHSNSNIGLILQSTWCQQGYKNIYLYEANNEHGVADTITNANIYMWHHPALMDTRTAKNPFESGKPLLSLHSFLTPITARSFYPQCFKSLFFPLLSLVSHSPPPSFSPYSPQCQPPLPLFSTRCGQWQKAMGQ